MVGMGLGVQSVPGGSAMRMSHGSVGITSLVVLLAGLGGGAVVFILQAVRWLQTETWTPVSIVTGLQWLHVKWAFVPKHWHELHEFLDKLPLALVLGVVGIISAQVPRSRD
jgi:hypothetical protein